MYHYIILMYHSICIILYVSFYMYHYIILMYHSICIYYHILSPHIYIYIKYLSGHRGAAPQPERPPPRTPPRFRSEGLMEVAKIALLALGALGLLK